MKLRNAAVALLLIAAPACTGQTGGSAHAPLSGVVADEQALLVAEAAYQGALVTADKAFDAGVLTGEKAKQAADLLDKAYAALLVVRSAHGAANNDQYAAIFAAVAQVQALAGEAK